MSPKKILYIWLDLIILASGLLRIYQKSITRIAFASSSFNQVKLILLSDIIMNNIFEFYLYSSAQSSTASLIFCMAAFFPILTSLVAALLFP